VIAQGFRVLALDESGRTRQALNAVVLTLLVVGGLLFVLPAVNVSLDDTLIRATPFLLTGLAVAVPARAGLVNIGGEGQLMIGMVFATGGALALDDQLPAPVLLPLLAALGMLGGIVFAGVAAVLRVAVGVNEALSTLLLNFVAPLVVAYLVHGRWIDPLGFNVPLTREFADSARLPVSETSQLHLGILLAPLAALLVWIVLDLTRWGFRLGIVGANPEAARRAGIAVQRNVVIALLAGGALAGFGGMIEVTGVEGVLRPGVALGFGYIGFLASWLVGHRPLGIVSAALLLGAISVGGDALQIDHNLPSTSVYTLMAVVLILVLFVRGRLVRSGP
jgi:general nucleoside transport system permease protein